MDGFGSECWTWEVTTGILTQLLSSLQESTLQGAEPFGIRSAVKSGTIKSPWMALLLNTWSQSGCFNRTEVSIKTKYTFQVFPESDPQYLAGLSTSTWNSSF